MIFKIIGVGICTIVVSIVLKQYKPELSVLVNICGGLVIFMFAIDGVSTLVSEFYSIENLTSQIEIVKPIMKVLGVGYITEFTANLAEDSGNKSVASKIVLGGKVAICTLALPILKQLINAIISLI